MIRKRSYPTKPARLRCSRHSHRLKRKRMRNLHASIPPPCPCLPPFSFTSFLQHRPHAAGRRARACGRAGRVPCLCPTYSPCTPPSSQTSQADDPATVTTLCHRDQTHRRDRAQPAGASPKVPTTGRPSQVLTTRQAGPCAGRRLSPRRRPAARIHGGDGFCRQAPGQSRTRVIITRRQRRRESGTGPGRSVQVGGAVRSSRGVAVEGGRPLPTSLQGWRPVRDHDGPNRLAGPSESRDWVSPSHAIDPGALSLHRHCRGPSRRPPPPPPGPAGGGAPGEAVRAAGSSLPDPRDGFGYLF